MKKKHLIENGKYFCHANAFMKKSRIAKNLDEVTCKNCMKLYENKHKIKTTASPIKVPKIKLSYYIHALNDAGNRYVCNPFIKITMGRTAKTYEQVNCINCKYIMRKRTIARYC